MSDESSWPTMVFDFAEKILADIKGANENDVAKLADKLEDCINNFVAELPEVEEDNTTSEEEDEPQDDESEQDKPKSEDEVI